MITLNVPNLTVPDWQIIYNEVDISSALTPMLLQIVYREAMGGMAAQLEFKVQDSMQQWQQSAYPKQGDTVTALLGYAGAVLYSCGTFEVDEFHLSGPPDVFAIRCLEAGIGSALRTPNSVAYENQTLTEIANTIAVRHGLALVATPATPDIIYKRVTQHLESDLAFLHRLANGHNYDFTVRNNQLIFYSRTALESAPPVGTLTREDVISFRFRNQSVGNRVYTKALVNYLDPAAKTVRSATASDPTSPTADVHKAVVRVENAQQAALRAQSNLHVSNMMQIVAEVVLPGTMSWRSGNTLIISGFGVFDTNSYIVREALHQMGENGYRTTLTLRTIVAQTGSSEAIASDAG